MFTAILLELLLSLPTDPSEARLILEIAQELLGWMQRR
jgi:hypothetical protein